MHEISKRGKGTTLLDLTSYSHYNRKHYYDDMGTSSSTRVATQFAIFPITSLGRPYNSVLP